MAMQSVRRITGNAASLLSSEVVNRATTFVLYAMVGRYLGAYEFGQLSLGLTFFFVSQVLAGAGLKTLITREVARDKIKTGQYLINGSLVVVVCSLLSSTILVLFVRLMNYSPETTSIILLLSLGVLPFSLSIICKAVFQAWERMHYIVWANVPVNVAKVGLAFLVLQQGYGLLPLILLLLASHVTILILEWCLMLRHIVMPRVKVDRHFCMAMIRSTSPFLGITLIVSINVNLDLVLLSRFTDEAQVGLYGAALQLITPLIVIYETVMLSAFPEICRRFTIGVEGLKGISEHLLELLLVIALPIVIALLFLAEPVLLFLYGDADFGLASRPLQILAWTLILTAFTHVLGRALVASLMEKVTLRIVVITTMIKLLLGLILIGQFGLIGAAVTVLLAAVADAFLHYASVSRLLFPIPVGRLAWKPLVAGTCMAAYVALMRGRGFFLIAVSGCAVYVGGLLVLMIWSNGGPRQFAAKYQHLWSN
jgi:O-antigen/teichoic acid export membrane protein